MFKNIIFDWSGVINDSVANQLTVINRIFEELHLKPISLIELKQEWEQPYMRFYNKYAPHLTLEEEQDAYRRAMAQSPKGKPYPGIVRAIKDFKKIGIKMAILSSDFPETLLPEIASFKLQDIFCDIITDVHDKSEGIDSLIKKHGFKLEETIFIGDSNHEIEEGKKAGVKTGAVTWGFSTKERLENLKPDFMITNINELKLVILNNL